MVFHDLNLYSTGTVYVNLLSEEESQERVRSAYSAKASTNYDRLTHIKARLDPDNFFRMNRKIVPAKTSLVQQRHLENVTQRRLVNST
jgi:hypothetical protein